MGFETCVVGALAVDFRCAEDVFSTGLCPNDFQDRVCRTVFEAAEAAYKAGKPFDAAFAAGCLSSQLEPAGAGESIRGAMISMPSARNAGTYAAELHRQGQLHRLRQSISDELYLDEVSDPAQLASTISDVCRVFLEAQKSSRQQSLGDVLTEYYRTKSTRLNALRIDTGYPALDSLLKGFWGGQLITIGARPGVGKSAFALDLAANAALRGHKTLYFSFEMAATELAERLVARRSGANMNQLIDLRADDEDCGLWRAIGSACTRMQDLPLFIDDDPGNTVSRIRAEAHSFKDLHLIVVDYLSLMRPERSERRYENRNLEIGAITRELKLLAKELNVPVVLLSQLSRQRDAGDRPTMSDLRDSGEIEQNSDKVLFLWEIAPADEDDGTSVIGVGIAKNRRGQRGTVAFEFDGSHMRYKELADYKISAQTSKRRGRWE